MSLTRKSWFTTGGNFTNPPQAMTYSSVVSRNTVLIILAIVALNEIDVRFFGIGNAYINADVDKKVQFYVSPEFAPKCAGCVTVPVKALYGLKSYGASLNNHLYWWMRNKNFGYCLADTDTWMRPTMKPNGGNCW